jgi:nitrile hydratase accessory protein
MSESSSIDPEAARRAAESIPGIPRDANGPVFRGPWEAHAFAMALALYEKGLFAWSEWSAMLGEEIKKAQAAGDPDKLNEFAVRRSVHRALPRAVMPRK